MRLRSVPLLVALSLVVTAPPLRAQAAPGRRALEGTVERTLTVDGRARRYLIHLPPGLAAGAPAPVVLVFHGFGGSADQVARELGFSALADREGFVAVYPDGIENRWRDGYAVRQGAGVDDYAFVRAVLADVGRQVAVDPRRTYAAGHSNGAFFTQALACRMPGTFAAIGAVAGQLAVSLRDACRDGTPVSMLEVHGTADQVVPFAGGPLRPGVELLSAEASAAFRAERAGCAPTPRATREGDVDARDGTSARHLVWDGCADGRGVELWIVDGGSHRWPGSTGFRGRRRTARTGTPSRAIDATTRIWDFFRAHPAPDAQPRAAECPSCAEWNAPAQPVHLYGNAYWVGTRGLGAILLTSSAGHVLIDGGLPESAPLIMANIRALGFRVEDVKLILNSHAHFDHAGGIAALQRASGAAVAASAPSAAVLRAGRSGPDDPQHGALLGFDPVASVRVIADGDTVRVGDVALVARFTPGHTPGGTTWTWRSCEAGRCLDFVYADSQTPISADGFLFTRNTSYPSAISDFEHGFAVLEGLRCDVLLTPHPGASRMWERLSARDAGAPDALVDGGACRRYAAAARAQLAQRVARERSSR